MLDRNYLNEFDSPLRKITGRAEVFTTSAIALGGRYVTIDNPDTTKPITAQLASKNLCPKASITSQESVVGFIHLTNIKKHGTYTLSSDITVFEDDEKTSRYSRIQVYYTDGSRTLKDGVWVSGETIRDGIARKFTVTVTTDSTKEIKEIEISPINYTGGGSGNNARADNIQLELGSTATPYTPYIDVTKSGYTRGEAIVDEAFSMDVGLVERYTQDTFVTITFVGDDYLEFDDGSYWLGESGQMSSDLDGVLNDFFTLGEVVCISPIDDGWGGTSMWLCKATKADKSISVYGKNLLPKNYFYDFYPDRDNECWVYGLPHGTYTLSGWITKYPDDTSTATRLKLVVYYKDGTTNLVFVGMDYECAESDGVPRFKQGTITTDTTKEIDKFFVSLDYSALNNPNRIAENVMLEFGSTATEYEPYQEPIVYTANEEGKIENIKPISPTTVIVPSDGFSVEVECKVCKCDDFYTHDKTLKSIKIDRQGESGKFFGFGIAQKATINILDTNREESLGNDNFIGISFNINNNDFENPFPNFYVKETKRNENTNELTITAEDKLFAAAGDFISSLNITSYTIGALAEAIAAYYGLGLDIVGVEDESFDLEFSNGANFGGNESFREVLNDIAEATQTIYYISGNTLIFKRLNLGTAADLAIEKKHYFTLESKEPVKLGAICHATELGDNVISSSIGGVTQYVRDNAFWELQENIGDLVEAAADAITGISITPFTCSWRGNFLAEIGDNLLITAKDDSTISTFLLNDSITYNGGFSQNTKWEYTETKETASNPATLGEKLNQTFARVDKVNKQIDIVASEADANKEAISALQVNTQGISGTVTSMEKQLKGNGESIEELIKKVEAQITDEEVNIAIKTALDNGVDKVETATGFTFNDEGLTVSKSNSEISTQITEDGMNIKKGSTEVLTANNEGVKAQDLHATTFLIIGNNSRFEDFGNRTACFWIGGNK